MQILVVTADPILRTFIFDILAERDIDVAGAASARAAVELLGHESCDTILVDAELADREAPTELLLAGIARRWPTIRRVVMSRELLRTVEHVLPKPFTPKQLLQALVLDAEPVEDEPPPATRRVRPSRFGAGLRMGRAESAHAG